MSEHIQEQKKRHRLSKAADKLALAANRFSDKQPEKAKLCIEREHKLRHNLAKS